VGVREAHALSGEAIEIGRGDSGVGIVTSHVAVAKIVSHNENNIRLSRRCPSKRQALWYRYGCGSEAHSLQKIAAVHSQLLSRGQYAVVFAD
jgi:hypothetical protein